METDKRKIERLRREKAEITEKYNELKRRFDESVPPPVPKPRRSEPSNTESDATESRTDSEVQRQWMQQLASLQERVTILEQVNVATQRREVQQEGVYVNLPSDSGYEPLRFGPTEEHVYARLRTHRDVLREQHNYLKEKLDAQIVAVHMYQNNALTLKDQQLIQSLRDRPVEAAETLLNIIIEQPDAVYLCFLDVLKHAANQPHLYQTLVQDGYKDYDEQSSHTSLIRQHYVFLLETMDVKFSLLLSHLYQADVLRTDEVEDIKAERTSFRANEQLLSALSRKSPQQFQLFLDALDNCGQSHVRDRITEQRGLSIIKNS